MTTRPKRTITKASLRKLAKAMGGRTQIAKSIGMSRPAVDRYFIGKGMREATHDAIAKLLDYHGINGKPGRRKAAEPELVPEPPTLEESGGHLFSLLAKALERNSGVDVLEAQLNRIEARLQRIEENQATSMKAWQMEPSRAGV